MVSLKIKQVKNFMGRLLASDMFDSFLLAEASVTTYNTFLIDGHQNKEFYTEEEWQEPSIRPYEFSMWKDIRPICFQLIKGNRTPVRFKFVLHLIPAYVEPILKDGSASITANQIKALVFTIKYDASGLVLTTGTSLHTFLPDKSADICWDKYGKLFLEQAGIDYEER